MRSSHDLICRSCGCRFYICSRCFRGQVYCSPSCREMSYKERRKRARKKYASTPKAQALHRERNKNYRVYGRQSSTVMDPSSDQGPIPVILIEINADHCLICKKRRMDENLELFSIAPD